MNNLKEIESFCKARAHAEEKTILNAIIGQTITNITVEPIKNRKHLKIVTITHTGPEKVKLEDTVDGGAVYAETNPLKLRVKAWRNLTCKTYMAG